jgi:GxxExxY protein
MVGAENRSGPELTSRAIGAAIDVHRVSGPGLLESAHEACLCHDLASIGISLRRQVPIPVFYKDIALECGYRADIVADGVLLLEIKSVESPLPIHDAQILTYMKLAKLSTGLLINFNVRLLRNGIKRFVL